LRSDLQWVPGESWLQIVYGASKLGAAGVGREIVLSLSANTDTSIGDVAVPYHAKRPMIFVALGLDGQLLWYRGFGDVEDSAASQITWHEPSSTWFVASTIQSTQPITLDLETVTQPPVPFEGRTALFGRFAP
jgi:hypothetical protein